MVDRVKPPQVRFEGVAIGQAKQIIETQNTAIDITPMTVQEARECADAIKGNLESLRLMLLQLHRREGWKALGYSSWRECAQKEFGQSQGYVYKLLHAAEVEENLAATGIIQLDKSEAISISQLEELHKLPSEQQAEGLQKAEEMARREGKKRTAAHVSAAVEEIKRPAQSTTSTDAEATELEVSSSGCVPATSVESVLPEVLANDEPQPTAAQLRSAWQKTDELLEALNVAQSEIEQLRNERDRLKDKVEQLAAELEAVRRHRGFAPPMRMLESEVDVSLPTMRIVSWRVCV